MLEVGEARITDPGVAQDEPTDLVVRTDQRGDAPRSASVTAVRSRTTDDNLSLLAWREPPSLSTSAFRRSRAVDRAPREPW